MVVDGPFKDLGFMRGEPTANAPLLRATTLEPFEERGDELAQAVVGQLDRVFDCLEHHVPTKRAWLSVRVGLGGKPESVEVSAGPEDAVDEELQTCLQAVFEPLRVTDESASGAFAFEYFPEASKAGRLPEAQPGQKAAIRYGGACFVWIEEPPCPPNKRCYPDRWEPSMCPHRAQQDGVYLRHDLNRAAAKQGWAESTALELVDPNGQPIWRNEWTPQEAERLPKFDPNVDYGDKVHGYIVEYGDATIRIADHLGVREYDRKTGARGAAWNAPKSASQFFVDTGTFATRGKAKCKGDTDHGQFATTCGKSLLYFNGYTFAVLDAQTLVPKAVTNLDAKTSSREADGADIVAKLAAGGVKLTIRGIIYMD